MLMSLSAIPAETDAAKKPSLSKKKVSLYVGDTTDISIKNAVKNAKVTWKQDSKSKKTVKIVKKKTKGRNAYARIKGIKAGKALLKAKYAAGKVKKALKCTITVRTVPDKPAAERTATPDNINSKATAEPIVKPAYPTSDPNGLKPYSLDLLDYNLFWSNDDCVLKYMDKKLIVYKYSNTGEFGFRLPDDKIGLGYDCVMIRFSGSSLGYSGMAVHYNTVQIQWQPDEKTYWNLDISNEVSIILASEETGLSTVRVCSNGDESTSEQGAAEIKEIIFYSSSNPPKGAPHATPEPTAEPTPTPISGTDPSTDIVQPISLDLSDSSLFWVSSDSQLSYSRETGQLIFKKNSKEGEFGFRLPEEKIGEDYNCLYIRFSDCTIEYSGLARHYNTDTITWLEGEESSERIDFTGSGHDNIVGEENGLSTGRIFGLYGDSADEGVAYIDEIIFYNIYNPPEGI